MGGSALPPPGAGPAPAYAPPPIQQTPIQQTPLPSVPLSSMPDNGSKASRRSMMIVLGAALAVVLVTVGFVVTRGGDDESAGDDTEVVGSDDTDDTDDTAAGDDTEAPDETEAPASTVVPATDAPDTTEAAPATVPITSPSADLVAGAPAGQGGTREAPVPLGSVADIGAGWRLQVVDVVPDATPAVMAENDFNELPPAGSTFTIVRVALGYFGLDDPESFFSPTISAIGAAAVELDTNCGVIPQPLDIFTDVFAGGAIVGNICFVTTPADPAVLQLYASSDFFFENEVFLDATKPPAPIEPFGPVIGPQPGAAATDSRTTGALPIGAAGDVGEGWSFAVASPARDITDQVLADNTFNDPPPEGFRFVGVDVALAYSGTGSASGFDVTAKWVGGGNVQRAGFCGVVTGELDQFTDVFAGGSVTGTMCFVVPQQEVGNGVLYVAAGFDSEPVYFATV